MTTNAGMLLEPWCCNPCDDGCGGCKDSCKCNIKSANPECLRVEVGECGEIILDPVCPPVVEWRDWIIVDEEPCEEWENCSKRYIVRWWPADDRKVAVCTQDTPGYLQDKLVAGEWIELDINCSNSGKIVINAKNSGWECEHPEIRIQNASQLIQATAWGPDKHTIYISDREKEYYDNNVCISFKVNQDKTCPIEASTWNMSDPVFVRHWDLVTGNKELAERWWIRIKESWYYRVFWQLTVQCNTTWPETSWLNLWRWLLEIWWSRFNAQNIKYLSTAKHWWYTVSTMLTWGRWINVDTNGVISIDGWYAPEWWGNVSFWSGSWVQTPRVPWPWMTFNVDCYVDLYKDELITVWFRWQSSMEGSATWNEIAYFRFVGQDDSSTRYNAMFWWTVLWVQMITPKLFQKDTSNRIYDTY